jgi:hypothetical protein
MKPIARIVVSIAIAAASAIATPTLFAQVPPHMPGTICFTPQFWCWASPPGPPGGACYCPSAFGWVQGRLG